MIRSARAGDCWLCSAGAEFSEVDDMKDEGHALDHHLLFEGRR